LLYKRKKELTQAYLPTQIANFDHIDHLIRTYNPVVVIVRAVELWKEAIPILREYPFIEVINKRSGSFKEKVDNEGNILPEDFQKILHRIEEEHFVSVSQTQERYKAIHIKFNHYIEQLSTINEAYQNGDFQSENYDIHTMTDGQVLYDHRDSTAFQEFHITELINQLNKDYQSLKTNNFNENQTIEDEIEKQYGFMVEENLDIPMDVADYLFHRHFHQDDLCTEHSIIGGYLLNTLKRFQTNEQ